MKFEISTTLAVIIFCVLVTFGFVWTGEHKDAPYTTYADVLLVSFLGVTAKRLAQKAPLFGGTGVKKTNGSPVVVGTNSGSVVSDPASGQQKD